MLLLGCGDSSSTTAPEAEGGSADSPPVRSAGSFEPREHEDSGGGSRQFRIEGGDNSVQEFGREASEAEMRAAGAALHGFFDARAAGDWAAACDYLARDFIRTVQQTTGGPGQDCAVLFEGLAEGVPRRELREAAYANVGSLRTDGEGGFLIYRGLPRGTVYAIPVSSEGGSWKIAAQAGTVLYMAREK